MNFALTLSPKIYKRLQNAFKTGITRPLAYRRHQLLQMARMMQDNYVAIEDALLHDLGRQRQEATTIESVLVMTAALNAAENLEEWNAPEKPKVDAWRSSWDTTVYHVPKGGGTHHCVS